MLVIRAVAGFRSHKWAWERCGGEGGSLRPLCQPSLEGLALWFSHMFFLPDKHEVGSTPPAFSEDTWPEAAGFLWSQRGERGCLQANSYDPFYLCYRRGHGLLIVPVSYRFSQVQAQVWIRADESCSSLIHFFAAWLLTMMSRHFM